MTTLHLRNSISRSLWRGGFLLIPLMLTCFALLPNAQAFTTDPDDTFPNFNTAAGLEALLANTGLGPSNTAYGVRALRANTIGGSNVGIGGFALINNVDGDMNTAVGNNAMFSNLHGDSNMALGQGALGSNVSGSRNVAMGAQALAGNTVTSNTAVGFQALLNNTTGGTIVVADGLGPNTAIGSQTLVVNVTGSNNNAVGYQALFSNNGSPTASPIPTGSFNNAHGNLALVSNTTGTENNAFGDQALVNNVTGNFNTAIGDLAGANITGNWNIDIGKDVFGTGGENFVTRIGISNPMDSHVQKKCFIGGIVNSPITGTPVVINSAGQLGIADASSARFKDEIKPMNKSSEAILALKPVTFRYKEEIDPARSQQFGLVAEEVAKVNPDLVTRDARGKLYTVRYEAVNAMLLNEFLKEHREVQELKKQVAALTAGLQKVNAQLELNKTSPQTVSNQ